ncbi:hypothetical protein ACGF3J_36895 [Streptomyces sp. NPDC048171]|uniref:hypothetical protein n=1 Tax=Streptomyces sp. NPDC048171 TaxID=3365504 RepID=UPI003717A2DA
MDELREEADRIQAEPAVAERDGQEWAIARSRVGEGLAPADEPVQGHARATQAAEERTAKSAQVPDAAKAKSQVPVWRQGLDRSVLSVDCRRVLEVLADRCRLGQGPLTYQETAALSGMDVLPAGVEAPRSKAKHRILMVRCPAPARRPRPDLPQGLRGDGRRARPGPIRGDNHGVGPTARFCEDGPS